MRSPLELELELYALPMAALLLLLLALGSTAATTVKNGTKPHIICTWPYLFSVPSYPIRASQLSLHGISLSRCCAVSR